VSFRQGCVTGCAFGNVRNCEPGLLVRKRSSPRFETAVKFCGVLEQRRTVHGLRPHQQGQDDLRVDLSRNTFACMHRWQDQRLSIRRNRSILVDSSNGSPRTSQSGQRLPFWFGCVSCGNSSFRGSASLAENPARFCAVRCGHFEESESQDFKLLLSCFRPCWPNHPYYSLPKVSR
jgi:hypothetical protein